MFPVDQFPPSFPVDQFPVAVPPYPLLAAVSHSTRQRREAPDDNHSEREEGECLQGCHQSRADE